MVNKTVWSYAQQKSHLRGRMLNKRVTRVAVCSTKQPPLCSMLNKTVTSAAVCSTKESPVWPYAQQNSQLFSPMLNKTVNCVTVWSTIQSPVGPYAQQTVTRVLNSNRLLAKQANAQIKCINAIANYFVQVCPEAFAQESSRKCGIYYKFKKVT